MNLAELGAIDCDVHPGLPNMSPLAPYLDDHWRESIETRGIKAVDSNAYPLNAPLTARPDWRGANGLAAADPAAIRRDLLDRFGIRHAILNPLSGFQLIFDEYMAAAFTAALNDWIRREWLDADPALRAAIVLPMQSAEAAVAEIERLAPDRRFVQVMVLAQGEVPLGRRSWWPVWRAAEKHDLPVAIHAGSAYRHPVTSIGWPNTYAEDYAAQSQAFQAQLTSLITEGVFAEFPGLKVVLVESGVSWLPAYLWRLGKFWRGLRSEVPWVDRPPHEVVREHVRLTMQPLDTPDDPALIARLIEHLRSDDLLLFASDYPHWQFDGDDVVPAGLPAGLLPKIAVDNVLATYPRLREIPS
jgi:predicted TIM-barrel fold metal-dependent hydrolase